MLLKYRASQPGDEMALKELWKTVFGDEESYIDGFFENMYDRAFVCEDDGRIVSAVHLLDIGEYVRDGKAEPATVLYAFATLPEYRGKGIGGKLSDMLIEESAETFRTVCPAEESLFAYYEKRYGYGSRFEVFEEKLENFSKTDEKVAAEPVSAQEYGKLREEFLSDVPHIRFNERALNYQRFLCKSSGGDMLSFEFDGKKGIAAFEVYGGCAVFKEVLYSGECKKALSKIAEGAGAHSAVIRKPADGGKFDRDFAMAMGEAEGGYYGFAFD